MGPVPAVGESGACAQGVSRASVLQGAQTWCHMSMCRRNWIGELLSALTQFGVLRG